MESKKVLSPVSRDFNIDDYIGMESCVDLKNHHKSTAEISPTKRLMQIGNKKMKDEKEYPPPIPLLVVMKRHYTGDGRLILTEEKIKHRGFLRAQRSDGRLMLQLVAVEVAEERQRDAGGFILGVAV
ncbi:hypothetical protein IC575_021834 [Cucumis melo]|uniref:FAF domain-containing protein n=1 Tax=Cucumis melo TaxID=3656 RepID=A0A1S3CCL8_CUCME